MTQPVGILRARTLPIQDIHVTLGDDEAALAFAAVVSLDLSCDRLHHRVF
jgi:hypothetical protein